MRSDGALTTHIASSGAATTHRFLSRILERTLPGMRPRWGRELKGLTDRRRIERAQAMRPRIQEDVARVFQRTGKLVPQRDRQTVGRRQHGHFEVRPAK